MHTAADVGCTAPAASVQWQQMGFRLQQSLQFWSRAVQRLASWGGIGVKFPGLQILLVSLRVL